MAPFFAAARDGRLVVQRCSDCALLRFPARELCSGCLSTASTWVEVSGRGEVFSFNVMHQVYHPAFAAEVPYAVVVVRLAEGVKLTSGARRLPARRDPDRDARQGGLRARVGRRRAAEVPPGLTLDPPKISPS